MVTREETKREQPGVITRQSAYVPVSNPCNRGPSVPLEWQ